MELKHIKTFESFNSIETANVTDEGFMSFMTTGTDKDEKLWKELSDLLKMDTTTGKSAATDAEIINFVKTNKSYDAAVKRINKGKKSGKLPSNPDILNKAVEERINGYKVKPEDFVNEIRSLLIAAKASASGKFMAYVKIESYDISDVKNPKVLQMSFDKLKIGSASF